MAINTIFTGTTANDGSGEVIRDAFDTVNSNFEFVQRGLYGGLEPAQIKATYVQAGYLISNTYIIANTFVNANSIVGNTVTSFGNLYVSQDGAYIVGNVNIIGNLNVTGSQAATQSASATAPIILIHANAAPYTLNDGKDIGLEWQYYDGTNKYAFLGWQNSTGSLVYLDSVTDTANVITAGTPGNVQFGSLLISNTTASTSNVTGALQVKGGAAVQGNLYVQSNVFIGNNASVANLTVRGFHVGDLNFAGADTIYINGSPVQTAAQAFNGGTVGLATTFNDATQATSTSTGAVRIANGGGLGVTGNVWASNIHVDIAGNIRGNLQGNVFTAAQPFITSLGTLTSLGIAGQLTTQNIIPSSGLLYDLGGPSNRYQNIYGFNLLLSGTLTGETVNSTGGTHTGNLALNLTNPALTTTSTGAAHLFNENATNVRIGAGGTTYFASNTQSVSATTGAILLRGGLGITSGNLNVAGSAGNSAVMTGNIWLNGNILPNGANVTHNLGSTTQWWNTFYGVSTQARYADLAEHYTADADYTVGTVVVFGGSEEISTTSTFADHRVAGAVSEKPAYLMNAASPGIPIALRGRVPVRVIGKVAKGDLLVTGTVPGTAVSVGGDTSFGVKIFAKSLQSSDDVGEKLVEAVIL